MIDLNGRVAIVTGASSGLGRRMAIELATKGATVVAMARRRPRLQELLPELQSRTPASELVVCDVSDTDAFTSALAGAEQRHARIDVLVNNAGISEPEGDGLEPYREVMETNYFAAVAGTLAVLPGMRARGDGDVVNVSSDSGRAPTPGEPAYSASKAALSAFTEALSFETEPDGVRLHVLYPGWVPTEMTEPGEHERLPPRAVRRTDEQIAKLLVKRLGTRRLEIDATWLARLAPVGRVLAPGAYRRGVRRAMGA